MMSHVANPKWLLLDKAISGYPKPCGSTNSSFFKLYLRSHIKTKTVDSILSNITSPHTLSSSAHLKSEKMASITASAAATSTVARTPILPKGSAIRAPPHVLGLPVIGKMGGKVKCSVEGKSGGEESKSKLGMSASLLAAACAATMSSPAAMALVDERLSTEGTGLPFGLSNNLLGWILLAVFGLIWALYVVYAGNLDEDEESGLSL